ncbi:alpha/beta hydrolase [Arthrobacter sp. NPDC080073]|uniref:alpha/beta fold hydrolase n=1 Tax=Arthrobacter sp. NPDC080073 TaxID=3155919 RepID=UPI003418924F
MQRRSSLSTTFPKSNYVDVDGVRTHYLEAGEGRPVVLLHAGEFGAAAELSWEHTIVPLAQQYRVIAPDWLGFGRTDKLHDFVSGHERRLIHMRRFLEIMGVGPAAFIGNSMGGLMIARAIARETPLFEAEVVVIVSAGGFSPDNESRRVLLDYDCTEDGMKRMLRVLFHSPRFAADPEYLRRRYELSVIPGAWECAAAARLKSPVTPIRSDFGVPDTTEWERIRVPVLLIAGANDPLKKPGYTKTLAARMPHAREIVYPECSHAPNIEVAEEFNTDVLAFLNERYPPLPAKNGKDLVKDGRDDT